MDGLLYVSLADSMIGVESKEARKERPIALRQEAVFGHAELNARTCNIILQSHRNLCIQGRVHLLDPFSAYGHSRHFYHHPQHRRQKVAQADPGP